MQYLNIIKDGKVIAEVCGCVNIVNSTVIISTAKEDKVNALKLALLVDGAKFQHNWLEVPAASVSYLSNSTKYTKLSIRIVQPEEKEEE